MIEKFFSTPEVLENYRSFCSRRLSLRHTGGTPVPPKFFSNFCSQVNFASSFPVSFLSNHPVPPFQGGDQPAENAASQNPEVS
jgi:hypothetical protein